MKQLFFTLLLISGIAFTSFGQNAAAKKSKFGSTGTTNAADKKAAAAAAQNQTAPASDLDPASLAGAASSSQSKFDPANKNKVKANSKVKQAAKTK